MSTKKGSPDTIIWPTRPQTEEEALAIINMINAEKEKQAKEWRKKISWKSSCNYVFS